MNKIFKLSTVVALVTDSAILMHEESCVTDLISFMVRAVLVYEESLTDAEKCRACLLVQYPFLRDIGEITKTNHRRVLEELVDELGFSNIKVSSLKSWMREMECV